MDKNGILSGIARIEKLVGEYNIWELKWSPYGKFKIKIFLSGVDQYTGYTNIHIIDSCGDFYCAVGYGKTEQEALTDTIQQYLKMVSWKDNWEESDFRWADVLDF